MGNGGSATTATHMATDLIKAAPGRERERARVFALPDNIALLTAYANDIGYEQVFAVQVQEFLDPGDVLIAIGVSGRSPIILAGLEAARQARAYTIGLLGTDGGLALGLVDVPILVPCNDSGVVESVHLAIVHALAGALCGWSSLSVKRQGDEQEPSRRTTR